MSRNADEQTAPAIIVREGTREDMHLVHAMIHELAAFEEFPEGPKLTVADLIHDSFECHPPWFFSLIAELNGEVVGHALCNRAYSSWTRRAFYLEDLYVRPSARRAGVGKALIKKLCQMAVRDGVSRIDWHVLESNAEALSFYARFGARDLRITEGRAALRLDAPGISAAASAQ